MQLLGGARRVRALSASPLPLHEAGVMQLLWARPSTILYHPPCASAGLHRSDDGDTRPMATTTSYTTSSCDRERVRRVRCVRDTYRESRPAIPRPRAGGRSRRTAPWRVRYTYVAPFVGGLPLRGPTLLITCQLPPSSVCVQARARRQSPGGVPCIWSHVVHRWLVQSVM